MGLRVPIWKINFFLFFGFQYYLDGEKGHKLPCVFENDCGSWFGSVFNVYLNISKVFTETVTQSATRFADVYFLPKTQVIQKIRLAEMHVK